MMDEPVVRSYTTFRCPRCNRAFMSREGYDEHDCTHSEELIAKAMSMVGEWVVVAGPEVSIVGVVRASEGPEVIVEGFISRHHERIIHTSWYERYSVHVSQVRDASGPHNAMLIMDSLIRAAFRDDFYSRYPEAGGDEE